MKNIVIIGAGPAGLATAYELIQQSTKKDFKITILEASNSVGGISKTVKYKGYRFDLGGHRFYTKYPEINEFYEKFLGPQMLRRKRLSRIYYSKKFFDYPLNATNALRNLGFIESFRIVASWAQRQFNKHPHEINFDQWVSNRFGDRLFSLFFKTYTEKVWGISTSYLSADWAAQRIQNFDLFKALINAITKKSMGSKTVIQHFFYPKFGPGMLYQKMEKLITEAGVEIHFDQKVTEIAIHDTHISTVTCVDSHGNKKIYKTDELVSTMPFNELILLLNPSKKINALISTLRFRHFITVNLIIKNNPFPDQWIYIHDPEFRVGRIQNFRNWSPFMVKKDSRNTPIGMEYFTNYDDDLWVKSDEELVTLAKGELVALGLVTSVDKIVEGFVERVHNAYPIYNLDYDKPLLAAKEFIKKFTNLNVCGRGGLFRYNNQDHSILTGFYVARNILSGKKLLDVWSVNDDEQYLEQHNTASKTLK